MYKAICFSLLLLSYISCKSSTHSEENSIIQNGNSEQIPYADFIKKVSAERMRLKHANPEKTTHYFFSLMNNNIPDYWNGTTWDFNGTTRIPQEGNIACGYFVTNTLSDLGFRIQRVKLAQVASSQMIQQLCVDIKTINGFDKFQEFMKTKPLESVSIVGLDFHTGYILKSATGTYFLHSNYIGREGVVKEKIEDSKALRNSKIYVVGSLSQNKKLLKDWVDN